MSFAGSFDQQLAEASEKVKIVEEACVKSRRDPATLRRSYLMYDPTERKSGGALAYYQSAGAFEEMAGRVMQAGFSELCLYYPILADEVPMRERIAQDVLPKLRQG